MNWREVFARWSQTDQYLGLDTLDVRPLFSNLWFNSDKNGHPAFLVGEIFAQPPMILFVNGTHRTRVLAKFMGAVPLAARTDIYRRRQFEACIIRRIDKDEIFTLPDLPNHPPQDLLRFRPSQ